MVDGVDLDVRAGEVVGLIGSNGAGKSTVMNAVGGFVPSTGRVEVFGQDLFGVSPSARARQGLGRTFQGAESFGDLTVRETVQVALHTRQRADLFSVMVGLPRAGRIERATRAEADEILGFLGLGASTGQFVSELSTGTRRILELACLLALESAGAVSRRTDRRYRAARERGVRSAHAAGPPGARREHAGHRA